MCTQHVHLHVHSEHSLLDGLPKVHELVERAVEIGSPALAITDHGVCGAIPDFIEACEKKGIKPIPGCEAYITRDRNVKGEFLKEYRTKIFDMYDVKDKPFKAFLKYIERNPDDFDQEARQLLKDYLMKHSVIRVDFDEELTLAEFRETIYDYMSYLNYHIVLIAINNQGLEDLYEIVSDAHINGFHSDPRTDLSFIRDRGLGKNIIATSACFGSWFSRLALSGHLDDAKALIQDYKETFHSFYLEKQATNIPDQLKLNALIDQLAIETDTPKIVTTDVHYANKNDNIIHDVLVAASMGKCVADENRYIYPHEYWMKDLNEIREVLQDDEAIANTVKIADIVNVSMPKEPLFPRFIVEEGDTAEQMLEKVAWNGLFTYAMKKSFDIEQYCQQLKYELEVINTQGFADYFLIVSDFIRWAKDNGYPVGPGRGSAAGALVSFTTGITTLDPIEWSLMFERFLNPERAGYPDIDIDFSYVGARAVQEYLKERYGADKVAQIGTTGTLAARASIRLIGKTLGYSLPDQDKFAKAIPEKPGISLQEAFDQEPAVQMYARKFPEWWEACTKLEGHARSEGVHAGGIVLSPEKLTKTVPLRTDKDDLATTMYDMAWIEKLLVKFDILKLDTLDLIKQTKENAGITDLDLDTINFNDPFIYQEVYNKLNLSGIFQCESDLFREIIKEMKPNSVQDISVIVALGRPGPLDLIPSYIRRKWGHERVSYPFPALEPILKDTYGVWVYQEQIMKASVVLGGFTAGQSDILRKGIAKKKHDIMEQWIGFMIYGSHAYDQEQAQKKAAGALDYDKKAPYNIPGAISRGFDEAVLLKIKADWIKFGDYCFNLAHSACYAVLSVQTAYLKAYYPEAFMAALLTVAEGKKDKHGDPKTIKYMRECEEMGIKILPPDINQSNAVWTPVDGSIRYGLAAIVGVSPPDAKIINAARPFTSFDQFLGLRLKLNKIKMQALIKSGAFDSMNSNRNLLLRQYFMFRDEDVSDMPAKTTKKDIIAYERELLGTTVSVKSRWQGIPDGKENIQMTGILVKVEPFKAKGTGKEHCRFTIETAEDEINGLVFNKTFLPIKDELQVGRRVTIVGNKSKEDYLANKVTFKTDEMEKWEVDLGA